MAGSRRWMGWIAPGLIALIAPVAWVASYDFPVSVTSSRAELHAEGYVEFTTRLLACNTGEITFQSARIRDSHPLNLRIVKEGGAPGGIKFSRDKWVYPPRSHVLGFYINHYPNPGRSIWVIYVPWWLFTILGAVPLGRRWARVWVAWDRSKRLRCPACGYDMRSSPQRCPECGATPGQVTLAADAAPAMAAVAKSSGTKCVALMAVYLAIVTFIAVGLGPTHRYMFYGEWPRFSFAYAWYLLALTVLLGGSFHAAGYSRSFEGFFGCGALSSMLLAPWYVHIGRSHSVWVQLAVVIGGAVAFGLLSCAAAGVRWRIQDRVDVHEIRAGKMTCEQAV